MTSSIQHQVSVKQWRQSEVLNTYSRVRNRRPPPPTIYFSKNAYQDILISNPSPRINFLSQEDNFSQPDPELAGESNSWSEILPTVCCLEKCLHD